MQIEELGICVRPAGAEDEEFAFSAECAYFEGHPERTPAAMAELWGQADSWPRKEFRARTEEGHAIIAAAPEGSIGYLRWNACVNSACPGGSAACVGHIFVSSSHRRKGIAQQMMTAFFKQAADEGFRTACLSVEAWNHSARSLYLKLGFTDAGEVLIKTLEAH